MSKRVKESGHSFRVKKAKREQENAALSGSLNRFLNIAPKPSSSNTEKKIESTESNVSESSDTEIDSIVSEEQCEAQSDDEMNGGSEKKT